MPKVLPVFPLYPKPTFLQYNVSLAIPGPKLWDIPKIGEFAKRSNFPNTQTSVLIPDVEYIKKFANYELGIANSILSSALNRNLLNIEDDSIRQQFEGLFEQNMADGLGAIAIEKSILASIFETKKPYFEIAQFIIKNLIKVEDIIARVAPLIGAATNPALALAIKSRKPTGNGPQENGILGPYGTPPAIGYNNGEFINGELDKLSTVSQKGDGVSIDKEGKYTKVNKPIKVPQEFSDINNIQFTYVTTSTIYTTGIFDNTVDYIYKYFDTDEEVLPEIKTPIEVEEDEILPDRIILGIFDKDGNPINPESKIKFLGVNSSGDLEIQDSIFDKAPWIKGEKWLFDKSIDYPNSFSWQTLDNLLFFWKKGNQKAGPLKDSPGDGWERVRYRDIINFDKEENQPLKFKENEFVTVLEPQTVKDYINYYDFLVDEKLQKQDISSEDKIEIRKSLRSLYVDSQGLPANQLKEQLENLPIYSDLKKTHYRGIEKNDYFTTTVSGQDDLNLGFRKTFKPMRFNIGGETVWVDPESEYDYKVIRVETLTKLDYLSPNRAGISIKENINDYQKNTDIKNFIKNKLIINLYDSNFRAPNGIQENFNIEVFKDEVNIENLSNVSSYALSNWNIAFDGSAAGFRIDNSSVYRFVISKSGSDAPSIFDGRIETYFNGRAFYTIDPIYQSSNLNKLKQWRIEEIKLDRKDNNIVKITKVGDNYKVTRVKEIRYNTAIVNEPTLYKKYIDTLAQSTLALATGNPILAASLATSALVFLNSSRQRIKFFNIDEEQVNEQQFLFRFLNYRDAVLELNNGVIQKWTFLNITLTKDDFINNEPVLPTFYKTTILNLNLRFNINNNTLLSNLDNISIETLPKFLIQVSDNYGSVIVPEKYNVKQILNRNLQELNKLTKSFSKGRYGSGWRGGDVVKDENGNVIFDENGQPEIVPDNPQFFGFNRRSQLTELDNDPYFIIEGVRRKKNEQIEETSNQSGTSGSGANQSGGGGFYRMPDAVGILSVLMDLIIDLSSKLFPQINKLISLLKNPASFVTEIIKSKVEEHFIIFSPRVTQILNEISTFKKRVETAIDENSKDDILSDMRNFVKNSELGNYIFVEDTGDFRFLLDGPALIGFFGILFGIELNISKAFDGGLPIKPIFSSTPSAGNLDNFIKQQGIQNKFNSVKNQSIFSNESSNLTDNLTQKELEDKVIKNIDLNKTDSNIKNKIVTKNGKLEHYEEVSIKYSTGNFIKGIDYEYIYIDQQIEDLIRQGDGAIDDFNKIEYLGTASSPIDNIDVAIEKYQAAYDLIDETDESKEPLRKLLLNKIKSLKDKVNILSQPLFKFILGIVTLPLKVVFEIINWLLDFFKKLTNPIKFPSLIAEFLSFKWIMKFFTPKGLLELAGIKFNPEKAAEWCVAVNAKNPLFGTVPGLPEYLIPDDYIIADLNEFLSVSFLVKLPSYTAKQYRDLCLKPYRILGTFFCLIEKLINAFIMLIWSVMGITAVIPPPLIKLCDKLPSENINPKDLRDILNGIFKENEISVVNPNLSTKDIQESDSSNTIGESYDFIYEVKLPDGRVIKNLDLVAVEELKKQYKDVNFEFLN